MTKQNKAFPFRSMGEWVAFLEDRGQLRHNSMDMNLRRDFGLVSKTIAEQNGPAIIHENVWGYPGWKIFTEGLTTIQRRAWALGVPAENIVANIADVLQTKTPIKPKIIDAGPCQEIKILGDAIDLTDLPIPYAGIYENPPYISAGISIIKDLDSDWYNSAIRRFQLKGKRKLCELVQLNQHEGQIFRKYVWAGKPMPIAIVIGADPLFYMLSQTPMANNVSEWDYWASFAGDPLPVVKCITNDLYVPAEAEIVIEGMIDPEEREFEGPFSEFPGFYSGCYLMPVIRVTAVTMRENPLYYNLYMGREPSEGHNMFHLMCSANMLMQARTLVTEIDDVQVLSTWSFSVAVRVDRKALKHGLIEKVGAAIKSIKGGVNTKNIFVFDDTVNIRNMDEILWALSVKFQPARDIFIIPKFITTVLDPSSPSLGYGPGVSSVAVYDCTEPLPPHDEPYRREIALPPVTERAREVLREIGLEI